MGGPADIPLTTPRLQLSFWASAPQAGLPDYRVRSARPSKGLKDISRKPSERGNLRVQRLRHGQLPSQPRDGGDKARPQAGPTWHCSPSPQALLRAVRREARTMHASRTQEGSGLSSTSPGPAGHPPPPSPRWGPGAAWTRPPPAPCCLPCATKSWRHSASADSPLPACSLWDFPHPARASACSPLQGGPLTGLPSRPGGGPELFPSPTCCVLLGWEPRLNLQSCPSPLLQTNEVHCQLSYLPHSFSSVQFRSVAQSCPTLCDPMDCSTPALPIHHQLPGLAQTHVH